MPGAPAEPARKPWWRYVLQSVAVAAVYVLTAKMGLRFDALAGVATTVWPPTGVALAALVLGGTRLAPAVFVGAFVVNATTGVPLWVAALIATGNGLEALAATALLRRWRFRPRMERLQDVVALGLAAVSATAISASFGTAAIFASRIPVPDGYLLFWTVWWVGDVLGALLVAPAIFCWLSDRRLTLQPLRWLEVALLGGALALMCLVVFHDLVRVRPVNLMRGTYSLWPLFLWAALRFGQRGTVTALLLVSAIAVSGTAAGRGVFSQEVLHERLFRVQCYMALTTVTVLTLAAAFAERRQAIRARDEFISIASHELKTPLTALILRVAFALRLVPPVAAESAPGDSRADKLRAALAAMDTITRRLTRLIDDLLDVSRIGFGQLALNLEEVEIGALLREIVARVRDQAAEAGSPVVLDVAAAATSLRGLWDRVRIEQVLQNLLSNAIKYGAGSEIAVSARAEGERVVIAVRDGGVGIDPRDQVRIFQAFERVEGVHRVGGLGLGLHIGRHIVEAHGGQLTVSSALGHGSTFIVDLPRRAPPPASPALS